MIKMRSIILCNSQVFAINTYIISLEGENTGFSFMFKFFFYTALIDAHAHAWFESQLRSTYFYNMYHISITLLLLKSMGSEKKLIKMNLHQKKCIWKRIASIGKGSAVGTHCIYIGWACEWVCMFKIEKQLNLPRCHSSYYFWSFFLFVFNISSLFLSYRSSIFLNIFRSFFCFIFFR